MNEKVEPLLADEGDAEIARIREVRHQISEQFGHDPYRLVAHYIERQKEHPEKLVPAPHAEVAAKRERRDQE
jgi:hypothetical protein